MSQGWVDGVSFLRRYLSIFSLFETYFIIYCRPKEKLEKGKCSESEAIELNTQLNILKGQLSTKGTNEFINESFKDSQYNGIF